MPDSLLTATDMSHRLAAFWEQLGCPLDKSDRGSIRVCVWEEMVLP